jgi:hypothetical protein
VVVEKLLALWCGISNNHYHYEKVSKNLKTNFDQIQINKKLCN